MNAVFGPRTQRWYHESNVRQKSGLTAYYHGRWFDSRRDPEPALREFLKDFDLHDADIVGIGRARYALPGSFLLGQPRDQYGECICHGDLHAGNLLVSESSEVVFIDFEMTGRGHVFEDFVVLEASVRSNHRAGLSFDELLSFEESGNGGDVNRGGPYQGLIGLIREHARANFPDEPWDNYLYALALSFFRTFRLDSLAEWQKEQLAAALLGAIARLGGRL